MSQRTTQKTLEIFLDDGNILFQEQDKIVSFELTVSGQYSITASPIPNSILRYNNSKILGISVTGFGTEPILHYEGKLKIITCKCIMFNGGKRKAVYKRKSFNTFNKFRSTFNASQEKWEDIKKDTTIKSVPFKNKVYWVHENFSTNGGSYILDGEDYKGEYHIHQDGLVMTGAKYTKNSKLLLKNMKRHSKLTTGAMKTLATIKSGGQY